MSKFEERLKKAMSLNNMKQIDLANKIGVNRAIISQYLSGKYKPKHDRIYELSKVLNVSPAWLMGYDVPIDRGNEISPMDFMHDVLPLIDKITNITEKEKQMMKDSIRFICDEEE